MPALKHTLAALTCTALLAGCADALRGGISDPTAAQAETKQNITTAASYFDAMCRLAGRCPSRTNLANDQGAWEDIIQTSFNDIDERCGNYLRALEEVRRDKRLWKSVWTGVAVPGKALFGYTHPGERAIRLVAAAFDFTNEAGNELFSAALLKEEPFIVERVVRKLQTEYRILLDEKFAALKHAKKWRNIDAAIAHYVVRGYLRLCLPITIESELKSTTTNVSYKQGARDIHIREVAALQVLKGLPAYFDDAPTKPVPGDGPGQIPGNSGQSQNEILVLRAALCLQQRTTAPNPTKELKELNDAVEEYIDGIANSTLEILINDNSTRTRIVAEGPCRGSGLESAFERGFVRANPNAQDQLKHVRDLHARLLRAITALGIAFTPPAGFDQQTSLGRESREALRLFRAKILPRSVPRARDDLDRELFAKLNSS